MILSAVTTGGINYFASLGAGIRNAIVSMPKVNSTSTALANVLNSVCSVVTEVVCDVMSIISGFFG